MIGALLAALPDAAATGVVNAMRTIEAALGGEARRAWLLRPLRPGDLGWIVSRHGAIYAQEFGWDGTFEVLVAEIGAGILRNFSPAHDAGWIAEQDGVPVGSVFLVRQSDEVAKLRLLLVEQAARGLGIGGARLVDECTPLRPRRGISAHYAVDAHSVLIAARRLYANAGYRLVHSEPLRDFGQDLTSETWELELD